LNRAAVHGPFFNVFVPKKAGVNRVTTDFRPLNEMTVGDAHPMQDVREVVDAVAKKKCFTVIDLKHGFFNIPLAKRSRHLTAVRTVLGLLQYRQLPQGLKNSPATFRRIITKVLEGIDDVFAYMDDIVVASDDLRVTRPLWSKSSHGSPPKV